MPCISVACRPCVRGYGRTPHGRPARGVGSSTSLFEVLDPERLDQEALKVVKSVEQELAGRAVAAYEDLASGR
ncbi:hypothetical protein [Streptomyces sp. NBC_01264]|uniref:hypothetical protein n=1 Tax=Streptomyces sp. NBC_01264 TaxID=2903804 RepID=UPI00224D4BD9|nr:hypothetical protein [Streptomyces sp. NBC_01264]MCX4783885.1 hypothetical protein [Streptomyces sp. NBC_01264]